MVLDDVSRSQLGWWSLGAALFALVGYVVYSFVGTFVFGIFLYYATRPIHRRIQRRVQPPSLAAGVSIFLLALPALGLAAYSLVIAARELQRYTELFPLDSSPLYDPATLERLVGPEGVLTGIDPGTILSGGSVDQVLASLASAFESVAMVGVGLVHLFVMVALAFYLLRDDHRLSQWALRRFSDDRGVFEEYLRSVDRDFNNIFFGNILNAVLTGTIGVIAYSALNVVAPAGHGIPAAALVGMLAGVASLIPVVGMKLVYFPVAAFMLARAVLTGETSALWFVIVFASVSFVVVDTIPDLVLRPYVSGRSLHVGSLMIAYTFGPLLFGWYGIFLMPMLLVLVVHFARVVLPVLLSPEPLRPYTVDPGYLVDGPGETAAGGVTENREAEPPVNGPDRSGGLPPDASPDADDG
ncbi:MAG: AI-2E family transporter [Haloferacaceae archaeon]